MPPLGPIRPRPLLFVIALGMKASWVPTVPIHTEMGWKAFLEPIRSAMEQAGLRDCVVRRKYENQYQTWCITENHNSEWRALDWYDIVSPKLHYDEKDIWTQALRQVYEAVRETYSVPSDDWGTRICVGRSPALTVAEMKTLAKTIMQHNHGFNALAWRLWSREVRDDAPTLYWVPSLGDSSSDAGRLMHEIQSAQSPEEIAQALYANTDGKKVARPWNFWPLTLPCFIWGTGVAEEHRFTGLVEYNLASGSATMEDAQMWINLVCLFVLGAFQHDGNWTGGTWSSSERIMFMASDLRKFVLEQARRLGVEEIQQRRLRTKLRYEVRLGQVDVGRELDVTERM